MNSLSASGLIVAVEAAGTELCSDATTASCAGAGVGLRVGVGLEAGTSECLSSFRARACFGLVLDPKSDLDFTPSSEVPDSRLGEDDPTAECLCVLCLVEG